MTVIEKNNEFYHDEHDCSVKVTNDNTKHLKTVTITLRVDLTHGKKLDDVVDMVNQAFDKANGNNIPQGTMEKLPSTSGKVRMG